MASTDFEAIKDEGINADSAWQTDYVRNIANSVKTIDGFKENKFSDNGKKTIDEILERLDLINKKVDETNFLYKKNPEKKELMDKLIEEVKTYQSNLAKIDSSEYKKSCDTYNDNVEAGRLAKITNDELDSLQAYKNNPENLTLNVSGNDTIDNNRKVSFTVNVARIDAGTEKLTVITRNLKTLYPELVNIRWTVKTKDNKFSVPDKISKKVKKSAIESICNKFKIAKKILDGRNRSTGRELDAKRDE